MFGVGRELTKALRDATRVRARGRARAARWTSAAVAAKHAPPNAVAAAAACARCSSSARRRRRAPYGDSAGAVMRATHAGSHVEALRLVLDAEALSERDRLGRFLPWLATIGSASPLIGLLGTVLGVISAFVGIATQGSGNLARRRARRRRGARRDGGGAQRRHSGDVRVQHLREPAEPARQPARGVRLDADRDARARGADLDARGAGASGCRSTRRSTSSASST